MSDPSSSPPDAATLLSHPTVAAFAPLVYLVHAELAVDGAERARLHDAIAGLRALSEDDRTALAAWFDEEAPPGNGALRTLGAAIAERAAALDAPPTELLGLGFALADPEAARADVRAAHAELVGLLGLSGAEAAGALFTASVAPPEVDDALEPSPETFDVAALAARLDRDHADVRRMIRAWLAEGRARGAYGLDLRAYRARVRRWLRALAELGVGALAYPGVTTERADRGAFLVAFEALAHGDLSLLVKMGVQWGLFGGAVDHLGTDAQRARWLPDVAALRLVGCFAMTELGHGSNVQALETVARWDADAGAFDLHTPYERARKEWIGGAGRDATHAAVFAQLVVGGARHGVHAFIVRIREDDGQPAPGVRAEGCGHKMGLNGVDNGRLWFDHVQVPRDHLLGRYAEVDADGVYTSPIASSARRFFTTLGALVGGRVAVASAAVSAARRGLAIAIMYASRRRQFGPPGAPERRVLDYPSHQRRLMPLLAGAYALRFACADLRARYAARTEETAREVDTLAAGLKAYATWFAIDALQSCRERCGGQGYLAVNQLPQIKADVDVFATFEGDNVVLMQLVAKGLLGRYQRRFAEGRVFALLRELATQARAAVTEKNPIAVRRTDPEHLRSRAFQLSAFRFREQSLTRSVARRLKRRLDDGVAPSDAFDGVQEHLISLARAHIERVAVERFNDEVDATEDPSLRAALDRLCDLFAMWRIEADDTWFLENGYIEVDKARAVRKLVDRLCAEVREDALSFVRAFGIPDGALLAPIALDGIDPRPTQLDIGREIEDIVAPDVPRSS